jgi:hypothetical protein
VLFAVDKWEYGDKFLGLAEGDCKIDYWCILLFCGNKIEL